MNRRKRLTFWGANEQDDSLKPHLDLHDAVAFVAMQVALVEVVPVSSR